MYLEWRRMIALSREDICKLKAGEQLYFISDYDEVNSFKDTQGNKRPFHKVCYRATVEAVYPYHVELWCEPIAESIKGWPVWQSLMKGHRESVSKYDGVEESKVHLYRNLVWNWEDDDAEDETEVYNMPEAIKNATLQEV